MWQQLNALKHLGHGHGQEVQLFFRANVRMGKKCDLSDFDHGMIVGATQGGLNISETDDLMGLSRRTVSPGFSSIRLNTSKK